MVIEECSSRKGRCFATITLTYDEIRDIANGLYYLSKDKPETVESMSKKVGVKDGGDR